jgi:Flp pilus assembly protein TadD
MDWVALGIVRERLKDRDGATVAFETALKMDEEDPLVAREAGIFYFKAGKSDKAYPYLQKAVIKNKRDALGLFYLGRLQAEADQYARAATTMRKVLELVPEDSEVYHHLGMILGKSGDTFGGNLNLAYAAVYSGDTRRANYHIGLARNSSNTDEQKKALETIENIIKERNAEG